MQNIIQNMPQFFIEPLDKLITIENLHQKYIEERDKFINENDLTDNQIKELFKSSRWEQYVKTHLKD